MVRGFPGGVERERGGFAHAFAGKAQQLRSSDAQQKKSESSTSHKTLSSGIVYRQTGITAPRHSQHSPTHADKRCPPSHPRVPCSNTRTDFHLPPPHRHPSFETASQSRFKEREIVPSKTLFDFNERLYESHLVPKVLCKLF